jgi:hypothetical protein
MKNTFRNEGQSYVKLKLKKFLPASYANAMTLQNRYLSMVRTITIIGIPCTAMKLLKHTLFMNDEVTYVAATNKMDTLGRWDIITMNVCQENLRTWLAKNLAKWIEEIPMNEILELPANYPSASIQSQNATTDNDGSLQGDVSYLSSSAGSCDSVVQNYDDEANFHEAPSSGIIKGMSWAQAVSQANERSLIFLT